MKNLKSYLHDTTLMCSTNLKYDPNYSLRNWRERLKIHRDRFLYRLGLRVKWQK